MRGDALHGIRNPKKLETCAIQRAQTGSASIDESLVDVEKEELHPLTTHQFFLGFKNLMSLDRIHLQFKSTIGLETGQTIGKYGVGHFVFVVASWSNHKSPLINGV